MSKSVKGFKTSQQIFFDNDLIKKFQSEFLPFSQIWCIYTSFIKNNFVKLVLVPALWQTVIFVLTFSLASLTLYISLYNLDPNWLFSLQSEIKADISLFAGLTPDEKQEAISLVSDSSNFFENIRNRYNLTMVTILEKVGLIGYHLITSILICLVGLICILRIQVKQIVSFGKSSLRYISLGSQLPLFVFVRVLIVVSVISLSVQLVWLTTLPSSIWTDKELFLSVLRNSDGLNATTLLFQTILLGLFGNSVYFLILERDSLQNSLKNSYRASRKVFWANLIRWSWFYVGYLGLNIALSFFIAILISLLVIFVTADAGLWLFLVGFLLLSIVITGTSFFMRSIFLAFEFVSYLNIMLLSSEKKDESLPGSSQNTLDIQANLSESKTLNTIE